MLVTEPIVPTRRIVWRSIGSVIAVITLLWSTTTAVSLLAFDRQHDHVVLHDAITRVVVEATGGSLSLLGTDTPGAVIDSTVTRGLFAPHHRHRIVDGELQLSQSCPALDLTICSIRTTVSVPRGVPVVVHATAGSIKLFGLAGTLDLSSTAGSIRGIGLTASHVSAQSSAGSIDLTFDRAPRSVDATSSAGSITIIVPPDDTIYRVSTHTTAGSVSQNIRTGPEGGHTINATASAGSIRITYPD